MKTQFRIATGLLAVAVAVCVWIALQGPVNPFVDADKSSTPQPSPTPPAIAKSSSTQPSPTAPATIAQTSPTQPSPTPEKLTADDIAGTGTEIADAQEKQTGIVSIDKATLMLETAVQNLECALLAAAETKEMKSLEEHIGKLTIEQNAYRVARKSGADAAQLREIAKRYAEHADIVMSIWAAEGGALADLRKADATFVDASWALQRAAKSMKTVDEAEAKYPKTVSDWKKLDAIRARLTINVGWDLRDAMKEKAERKESTDETVRQRELLKAVVVYLEVLAS